MAKDNAALSGLRDAPIRYISDDANKFVRREQNRGSLYDGIIMDPPSYGRGPSGEVWRFETDVPRLIEECVKLLSKDPAFFIINSYTAGYSPSVTGYLLRPDPYQTIRRNGRGWRAGLAGHSHRTGTALRQHGAVETGKRMMIETRELTFAYQNEDTRREVLHELTISVPEGQFLAVVGHNGSGKSTLAKHFNAILLPQWGQSIYRRYGYHRRKSALCYS